MNNNARTNGNPVAQLLQQALSLTQQQVGIPVLIDYESIARAVIKVMREEQKREDRNPERLLQQAEVYRRYGKEVILTLVRRGKLQKYRFDLVEKYDEEGNVVKYPKGYVYYRPAEIEAAIEENNLLKGVKNVEVD